MSMDYYKLYKNMPLDELSKKAAGDSSGCAVRIAQFVLKERMLEKQHNYAKEQIEIQHTRNLEVVKKQNRLLISSTILTVIAMLASVILGYRLEEMKKYSPTSVSTVQSAQQKHKQQTKP